MKKLSDGTVIIIILCIGFISMLAFLHVCAEGHYKAKLETIIHEALYGKEYYDFVEQKAYYFYKTHVSAIRTKDGETFYEVSMPDEIYQVRQRVDELNRQYWKN